MPDIRTAAQLDDFARAPENPLQYPWVKADATPWAVNMFLDSSSRIIGVAGDSMYAYTGASATGDMEVWGIPIVSADITEAWRMALLKDVGSSGAADGYAMRLAYLIGDEQLTINRVSNGGQTTIANVNVAGVDNPPAYMMLRLIGSAVEAWFGDASHNWTLMTSATDSTYRDDLHGCLGCASDDGTGPGWDAFGATTEDDLVQIYRRPNE